MPSDYYLFGTLKDALQSCQFSLDKAVLETEQNRQVYFIQFSINK